MGSKEQKLVHSGNLRNFWGRAVRGAGLAQQPVEKRHALGQTCHHFKKLYPIVSLESIQVNTNQRKKRSDISYPKVVVDFFMLLLHICYYYICTCFSILC